MGVLVHSAAIQDRDGGRLLMAAQLGQADEPTSRLRTRLAKVWADSAYAGAFEAFLATYGVKAEIVRRPGEGPKQMWVAPGEEPEPRVAGFHLVAHRWIVERTIGWLNRYRRLAKDYEQHPRISEAWICVASIRLMLARLEAI